MLAGARFLSVIGWLREGEDVLDVYDEEFGKPDALKVAEQWDDEENTLQPLLDLEEAALEEGATITPEMYYITAATVGQVIDEQKDEEERSLIQALASLRENLVALAAWEAGAHDEAAAAKPQEGGMTPPEPGPEPEPEPDDAETPMT